MIEQVGTYFYFFPTYNQGKKILWEGRDKDGFKFTDHIPEEIRTRTNSTEMLIEIQNGSIFQVIGTDNIDSIVGTNPIGCVFSEYALQNPDAWRFIRPILAENGGWAVFNYTPRGKNHGFDLYQLAKREKSWFVELLTVDDTKAISQEVLEQEKVEIIDDTGDDALFYQEYYCSFDAPMQGSYYGKQIIQLEKNKQITKVPHDETLMVDTWWDLGVADSTAIWFTQTVGNEIRVINYFEDSGEGLAYYIGKLNEMKDEYGYIYRYHHAPHDIEVRELGTGKSRYEVAQGLGIDFYIVPNIPVEDGINAVRSILKRCWFDQEKCKDGLNALMCYHKEWDDKRQEFKPKPYHDWSSHGSDSFRYLAVGHMDEQKAPSHIEEQDSFDKYELI
uniref:Putative terminase n=1 Tax=viral metagenome TaxID=1070528 RepID=A0A6M3IM29_9ZZZZ